MASRNSCGPGRRYSTRARSTNSQISCSQSFAYPPLFPFSMIFVYSLQYAGSIDEYTNIMLEGNNGGYANDWLLGDRKTGEIAQLELGLRAHQLWKTKDGVLAGSNWARDLQVLKEDAPQFDPANKESSPNARRARGDE